MLRHGSVLIAVVLALVVSAVPAQERRAPGAGLGGMQMPSSMLLRIPEVRTELGVSESQKKQLDDLAAEVTEQLKSSFGQFNFQEFQKLSQEEREKRMSEMRTKAEETGKQVDAKVNKILDSKQLARLNQLQIQREGSAAFSRPEVVKRLSLTEQQQEKIKKIQDDSRPQLRGMQNMSETERREMFTKMQDQRKKALTDIQALLTDEQTLEWAEMWGKDFKFPEPQAFGGFGRGKDSGERRGPPAKE
jgi:hypothetical protein